MLTVEVKDRILRRAAKELRTRLSMTQAAFAQRIGKTIPSILRYETQVPPRGQALVVYADLAIKNRFKDLGTLFRSAILEENGPALELVMNWNPKTVSSNTIEKFSEGESGTGSVETFMNASPENRQLVKNLCEFMAANNLQPIEELARQTIKQVLLEQSNATSVRQKQSRT